ncbi:MAG: LacI family DNA-binding transcriptional regulator, partial [Nitrososphaerales archaeon]
MARRAKVSQATVSRVLSRSSHPVRKETAERVLLAAEELDFQPNMLARALATDRTRTVGVIVHDVADPYFGEIVRGVENTAHSNGYQVFVCSSDRDPERELAYVESLLARRVDALLFVGGAIEDKAYQSKLKVVLSEFEERGGVVVALSPQIYESPRVLVDNRRGMELVTEHLVALGHRRIAFVSGPPTIRTARIRFAGFRDGLRKAGIAFDPALVACGGFGSEGGAEAAAQLIDQGGRPFTVLAAANDVMAFGVLHELATRGVRVPEDISVTGFDDVQMAAISRPPLT